MNILLLKKMSNITGNNSIDEMISMNGYILSNIIVDGIGIVLCIIGLCKLLILILLRKSSLH